MYLYVWSFPSGSWHRTSKTPGTSWVKEGTGVSLAVHNKLHLIIPEYVLMRWPSGSFGMGAAYQRNHVIRGLEPSASPSNLHGGERGWRRSESPMATDLINHAHTMNPYATRLPTSVPGGWCAVREHGSSRHSHISLTALLPFDYSWILSFIKKTVIAGKGFPWIL